MAQMRVGGVKNNTPKSNLPHKEEQKMAKKVTGYIKLQLPAGKASAQPPVGPALGQHGVSIPNFTKELTKEQRKISVLSSP